MNIEQKYESFKPLINKDTEILILGSLPSVKSLEFKEYYGHPRNRIWKILAYLLNTEIPDTYQNKKQFLHDNRIGLWDVIKNANREGSLDSNIKNETPNEINKILEKFKSIKVVGFNGKKSEQLYHKYFDLNSNIHYVSLPSSSPANMSFNFEQISKKWSNLFRR